MSGGEKKLSCGPFVGGVLTDVEIFFNEDSLAVFGEQVRAAKEGVLSEGRHRVVVMPFESGGQKIEVAVKAFGKQGGLKDRYDAKKGTKAARSFRAAKFLKSHGVGTPEPMAYLEHWEGGRLVESFYLSAYVEGLISFKDGLIEIYEEKSDCRFLVSRLEHVARAIRRMHDAGFCHRDLGNQNMEFQVAEDGMWGEVQFIDLNRGRIREELSEKERAKDFARIRLPSEFLKVFVRIYWEGNPPAAFDKEMGRLRRRFARWERTRKWRHPFRKRTGGAGLRYPDVQDIWIWDKESAQASITMARSERRRHYPSGRHLAVAKGVLSSGKRVWDEYQVLMKTPFGRPVSLRGKFGMALESADLDFGRQSELLKELEEVSVLLRFCHHEGQERWQEGVAQVKQLVASGREVMIAMVQDRRAVKEPGSWAEFLNEVVGEVGDLVTGVEICHAVNRMKWGVHGPADQAALLAPLGELQERFPEVVFTGPACIDFEYHYIFSALDQVPEGVRYGALSHHLYVDRRGAPENFQGKFSTLEKCALLRAVAKTLPNCDDRVIISEVNWPLKGTGIWSPVTATYVNPNSPEHSLSVSEFEYGVYMLRYLVIAVCSGFVDQVYWWRLVAHGFGLVDERAEGGWRKRVGFQMLQVFLRELGSATFVEKLDVERDVYALRFEREGLPVTMLWCNGRSFSGPWPNEFTSVLDALGEELELTEVSEAPVYLIG